MKRHFMEKFYYVIFYKKSKCISYKYIFVDEEQKRLVFIQNKHRFIDVPIIFIYISVICNKLKIAHACIGGEYMGMMNAT